MSIEQTKTTVGHTEPRDNPVTYAEHFIRLIRGPEPIKALAVLTTAHYEHGETEGIHFWHFPDDSCVGYDSRTAPHTVWEQT